MTRVDPYDDSRRGGDPHVHRYGGRGRRLPCRVRGCDWHRRSKVEPVVPADFGPGLVRDPTTREEWQEAADMAQFFLALDSAWQYGFIEPDPQVNVERCARILELAAEFGITPRSLDGSTTDPAD